MRFVLSIESDSRQELIDFLGVGLVRANLADEERVKAVTEPPLGRRPGRPRKKGLPAVAVVPVVEPEKEAAPPAPTAHVPGDLSPEALNNIMRVTQAFLNAHGMPALFERLQALGVRRVTELQGKGLAAFLSQLEKDTPAELPAPA